MNFSIITFCLMISMRSEAIFQTTKCCENGWIVYEDSCYFVGRFHRTYQAAQKYCESIDASLFVIDSTNEWDAIRPHMVRSLWSWIGLTVADSGSFVLKWDEPSNYNPEFLPWLVNAYGHGSAPLIQCVSYFSSPEPNLSYVHFYDCNLRHFFICERNSTLLGMLTL